MTHNAEFTATSSAAKCVDRSAAAERMRLHRERRRKGLRCFMVQLRETEVEALICKGLLKPEMRNDPRAIVQALHSHLDRTLGSKRFAS